MLKILNKAKMRKIVMYGCTCFHFHGSLLRWQRFANRRPILGFCPEIITFFTSPKKWKTFSKYGYVTDDNVIIVENMVKERKKQKRRTNRKKRKLNKIQGREEGRKEGRE